MEKKYSSLRVIAWVISVIAWASLIIVFLEIGFLGIIAEGAARISKDSQELYYFVKAINTALGLNAIMILISGLISFILLNSIAERIRLFIDIETNSRVINNSLLKIINILEEKFDIKAKEPEYEKSIFKILKDKFDNL
jgi:hypothetical protein